MDEKERRQLIFAKPEYKQARAQTVAELSANWNISEEIAVNLNNGDKKAIRAFYMANEEQIRRRAYCYIYSSFCPFELSKNGEWTECAQQVYIDLPLFDFSNVKRFYSSLYRSFHYAGRGGISCLTCVNKLISLDAPIKSDGHEDGTPRVEFIKDNRYEPFKFLISEAINAKANEKTIEAREDEIIKFLLKSFKTHNEFLYMFGVVFLNMNRTELNAEIKSGEIIKALPQKVLRLLKQREAQNGEAVA